MSEMEIEGGDLSMEKRIVELEVECEHLKLEKTKLEREVNHKKEKMKEKKTKLETEVNHEKEKMKDKYIKLKEKLNSLQRMWKEENDMIKEKDMHLEVQKRKLEVDLKAARSKRTRGDDMAELKLKEAQAKIERLNTELREKEGVITTLLGKNNDLDMQCNQFEMDFKTKMSVNANMLNLEKQKNLELIKKVQVLEQKQKLEEEKTLELKQKMGALVREKEHMVAQLSKLQKERNAEAKSLINISKAMEAEKNRIEALQREKEAMKKQFSVCIMEKCEEVKRILSERRAFEEVTKKDREELTNRIKSLEAENTELKEEVDRNFKEKINERRRVLEESKKKLVALEEEKNAEIQRISKEKMALKEEGENMKMERDQLAEAVQVLREENESLEEQKKELQRERADIEVKIEKDEGISSQGKVLNAKKQTEWNQFQQLLRTRKPSVQLEFCSGFHVIEYLKFVDNFGKIKVHSNTCPCTKHLKPSCPCPSRQAWGYLDSLVGRLRFAFEVYRGRREPNPFAAHSVQMYLQKLCQAQSKARCGV